jgi:hypothetical protein
MIARRPGGLCLGGVIMPTTNDMDKKQQGLEPCEGRLSCTVLRGLGRGNMPWLPGASRRGSPRAFGCREKV